MAIDFSEFSKQDQKSWENAALKALKGRPLEDLHWQVDDSINMQPFYATSYEKNGNGELDHPKSNNHWYIGETFDGGSPENTNYQLLNALNFGLDAPLILDAQDYDGCLDKVELDFLFPIFRSSDLEGFLNWIDQKDWDNHALEGAFIAFEAGFDKIDISDSVGDLRKLSKAVPKYYTTHITFAIDPDNLGKSIGRHLIQLSDLIQQLLHHQLPVKIICEIESDNDFLKNIAVYRALRLLFAQICKSYQIPSDAILMDAYVYQQAQDVQLAMIAASSQAVAAVTAGVDRLTISCEALSVEEDEDVTRRMTRNIHHLMKMESGMDSTVDPLAGSYTIELLTKKIAEASWKTFQKG